jgi:ubiquinone/menaquinone biosynthesis C-methylase UbiE
MSSPSFRSDGICSDFIAGQILHPSETGARQKVKTKTPKNPYVLVQAEFELRRSMRQARLLAPITRRLFSDAGLSRDMRVLDVGCGSGDVSMLAADIIGPGGVVVGIDLSKAAIDRARERAQATGYVNIEFYQCNAEPFNAHYLFDFAVSRNILVYQPDPAAFIRAIAAKVRPGGVIAFHELGLHDKRSLTEPPNPLFSQVYDWIITALQSLTRNPDAGARIVEHFHNAGVVRAPTVFCEVPSDSGPQSAICGWYVQTLRCLMPQLEKIGAATAKDIDIETLEDRLSSTAVELRSLFMGPLQYCAWARL